MGLESFVQSARRNSPAIKSRPELEKKSPAPGIIQNTENSLFSKTGEKTITVAKENTVFKWKKCPHIKCKETGNPVCGKFFSLCAKEKCKQKFAFGEQ